MKWLERLSHFYDRVLDITVYLSGAIVVFFSITMVLDVLLRWLVGITLGPVTDINSMSLAYVAFLPAAWLLKQEKHINVGIFSDKLHGRAKAWFMIVTSILGIGISLILIRYGGMVTLDFMARDVKTIGVMGHPAWIEVIIIPIGGLLLLIQFIRRMVSWWIRKNQTTLQNVGLE